MADAADIPAAAPRLSPPVELDTPLKRGDQAVASIRVRKPMSGELRGLSLVDLAQLDVVALRKLLPRITVPNLTEPEVDQLDPADLLALGAEVSAFLLQKGQRPESLDG